MGDRAPRTGKTKDEDQDLTSLRQKVAEYALPRKLLETLVAMARSSQEGEMLHATLQQTLDVSTELTNAEEGSIFLFDNQGRIANYLLSQTEAESPSNVQKPDRLVDRGLVGWVKQHRQVGLMADTQQDARWLPKGDRADPVRSALVVPILRGEELLGIVSLLHSQPQHFSPKTADLMQAIAEQIALVLKNARLYSELMSSKIALNQELERGQAIQRNFLPAQIPQYPGWDIAALFKPARLVAGDFYDIFELPESQLGFVIADVCDKGVGAALFMALFRSLIRIFSGQTTLDRVSWRSEFNAVLLDKLSSIPTPLEAVNDSKRHLRRPKPAHIHALKAVRLTNNYIALNHGDLAMFATLFFGVLDPKTGVLTYINAGHDPLFVVKQDGEVKEFLEPTGPAVGLFPDLKFRMRQTYLAPGEMLLGYTDGVTEAREPGGRFFSEERLRSMLKSGASCAAVLLEAIAAEVALHTGMTNQADDITLLAVRRDMTKE